MHARPGRACSSWAAGHAARLARTLGPQPRWPPCQPGPPLGSEPLPDRPRPPCRAVSVCLFLKSISTKVSHCLFCRRVVGEDVQQPPALEAVDAGAHGERTGAPAGLRPRPHAFIGAAACFACKPAMACMRAFARWPVQVVRAAVRLPCGTRASRRRLAASTACLVPGTWPGCGHVARAARLLAQESEVGLHAANPTPTPPLASPLQGPYYAPA